MVFLMSTHSLTYSHDERLAPNLHSKPRSSTQCSLLIRKQIAERKAAALAAPAGTFMGSGLFSDWVLRILSGGVLLTGLWFSD